MKGKGRREGKGLSSHRKKFLAPPLDGGDHWPCSWLPAL